MKNKNRSDFDEQDVRIYRKMSVHEKFKWLNEMGKFLAKITPKKSKQISERLKREGF